MPLEKGSSKDVVRRNTEELVSSYRQKGSIGTSHPGSVSEAYKQAYAIAMSKAGRSRKKR